jgi:hypothetical protein
MQSSWFGDLLDVDYIGTVCPRVVEAPCRVAVRIDNTRAATHEQPHLSSCTGSTVSVALALVHYFTSDDLPAHP